MACLQLAPAGVKEGRATGSARCQCSIGGGGGKVSRGRTSEAGTAAWRSHGGTVFEMPIGWTIFQIPSTAWAPTVRSIGRVRPRWEPLHCRGASSLLGARGSSAGGRGASVARKMGDAASGLLASVAMAAGRVVRARPDMFVETPHRRPARPGTCPGAARCGHWTRRLSPELDWKATGSCPRAWNRQQLATTSLSATRARLLRAGCAAA